jgi:hypothetical protein
MSSKVAKFKQYALKQKKIKLILNKKIIQNNILFAPCNFCNRKPGFFSGGINYCYVHWFDNKNKSTNL